MVFARAGGVAMLCGVRVLEANRSQLSWDLVDLEALLPAEHRARLVWRFVETLDLTGFYQPIRSRDGAAGRPAADPKVLLALWLYATLEGVGAARELDRLVSRDVAYRWLAGVCRSTTTGFRISGSDGPGSWIGC
jgi:transposase